MNGSWDAIVIGGGHNGLIAGGCTDTSTPWPEHPDFKVITCSCVVSLLPDSIVSELGLRQFG